MTREKQIATAARANAKYYDMGIGKEEYCEIFSTGAKWADKTMILKAQIWLYKNNNWGSANWKEKEKFIESFGKALGEL